MNSPGSRDAGSSDGDSVRVWMTKTATYILIVAVALFGSAGTLRWSGGWLYLGLLVANQLILGAILSRRSPAYLAGDPGAKAYVRWFDVRLAVLASSVGPLVMIIVSGLDVRYDWIGYLLPQTVVIAFALAAAGSSLTTWAMLNNPAFVAVASSGLGRQTQVVSSGPYAYVRHPGYLGSIVVTGATPFVLGSQWAVFAAYIIVIIILVRTFLEDRMLLSELPGYEEYASRVRYRLLPGIW